jgi:hypothetical protein
MFLSTEPLRKRKEFQNTKFFTEEFFRSGNNAIFNTGTKTISHNYKTPLEKPILVLLQFVGTYD